MMIKNAYAIKRDKAGELSKDFLSLYISKTHGLHQLFEDADMGDFIFSEGVSTNMWAGIFTQVQKLAPGPFSPSSFNKATAISCNSEKDRSLLLEIYSSTKGGLNKSIDDVKFLAKTTVMVSQDFHSFYFLLKALGFVFGKDSILVLDIDRWLICI
jgi:hypothetical protein